MKENKPTFSILIVSKNRKTDLYKTLLILKSLINCNEVEVLVFLDGCSDNSEDLKAEFDWVRWFSASKSIGASAARHQIYPLALSEILIGLDDDAHPLNQDFLFKIKNKFKQYPTLGILAFEEIKGIFSSTDEALKKAENENKEFFTNEFIGCGFAIKKSVYNQTNGFPSWIDIYGEESCLSIEVLNKGYDILYTNGIKINHRVDIESRKKSNQNYFRFHKQLKNSTYYYLVYYKFPMIKILKLYFHNFRKYALKDSTYFKNYFSVIGEVLRNLPTIWRYRNPVPKEVLQKMKYLSNLKF